MKFAFTLLIAMLLCLGAGAASINYYTLTGKVVDASTGEPLDFATISVRTAASSPLYTTSDGEGRWALRLPGGRYAVAVSYVGYVAYADSVVVTADRRLTLRLSPQTMALGEVVVTAREAGLSSGSRIDRSAMEHLQPNSFADLLELLPGNISKTPAMGSASTITLRETGGMSATGAASSLSDDYAITSLGTAFVIDGAPVGGDANLQRVPGAASTDASAKRSTVNRGVDMRTIPTDNIESVEVIRGIPSAEYGNLTSGVVNIRRSAHATPFTARFKADSFSKLFAAGKGIGLGGRGNTLSIDGGLLDSKIDPRDNLESYKRLNGSLRGNFSFLRNDISTRLNLSADYTGSFDNAKQDPDLNYNKIDEFKSIYNRYAFATELKVRHERLKRLPSLTFNGSVSYERDRIEQRKQVAPQRASVAPTSMEAGVHDGKYLLSEYIADFVSDGRPLDLCLKLRLDGTLAAGLLLNSYKAGTEWSLAKNLGHGQIYDLERPLSASWTTRPRDFSTIPALSVLSFYGEDHATLPLGASKLDLQLGARTIALTGLDSRYYLAGRTYVDPRLNAELTLPRRTLAGRLLKVSFAGGFGLTTKMPTVDYLYPQVYYNDIIQLNYYNTVRPTEYSRVSLRTYIDDPVNYDLRPARNRKWELRLGLEWGGNSLSATYFQERMRSGFRYSTVYSAYDYRKYDASGIDGTTLTAAPELDALPYADRRMLDGMRRVGNGSRIDKEGLEFQLSTARWQPLRTSLIVSGAWLRTRYSNSQMLYATVTDVVGSDAVSDLYVGLYDTNDGRINEQLNTNFTLDTQVPRWGLIFTSAVQCMWWTQTTRLTQNGVPSAYIAASDGELHPYTEADRSDLYLQYLVKKYNAESFVPQRVPIALFFNLKATKRVGRWVKLSAFVNRIVDWQPDYKSNGLTIRRTADAYFGMEANITL